MKRFTKVGALFVLLVSLGMVVAGCSGGDAGMGKKVDNSISGLAG